MTRTTGWIAGGLIIGVALAIGGARAIRNLLFEIDPIDGPTYASVIVFLLIIVAIASYLPARRAAKIDPMVTLRR